MRRAIWTPRFARAHFARRSSLRSGRVAAGWLFARALIAFVVAFLGR